ncbi:MAG: hypothetical protein ACYC2O_06505 [Microthrixaceae bacterium]
MPPRLRRHPTPTEPSSPDWWHLPSIAPTASITVADTDRHQGALHEVADHWPSRNVTAQLLADPEDPTDRHAVVVLLDGYRVGRLGHDRDPRFPAIVTHLSRTQGTVRVRARMTDLAAPDAMHRNRGLVLFAHPECFDPARHLFAGDRLVDVRPGLDALAIVGDLTEHAPFAVELVESGDRVGVALRDADDSASPVHRPGVTDPLLGTLAVDLAESVRPLVRAAAARGRAPSCLASWSPDITGRPMIRLHLIDRPELLHDVCAPPAAERTSTNR